MDVLIHAVMVMVVVVVVVVVEGTSYMADKGNRERVQVEWTDSFG